MSITIQEIWWRAKYDLYRNSNSPVKLSGTIKNWRSFCVFPLVLAHQSTERKFSKGMVSRCIIYIKINTNNYIQICWGKVHLGLLNWGRMCVEKISKLLAKLQGESVHCSVSPGLVGTWIRWPVLEKLGLECLHSFLTLHQDFSNWGSNLGLWHPPYTMQTRITPTISQTP